MRKTYLASALLVIALAACGKQEQPAPAAQAPAPASTGAPSAVTAPRAPAPKPGRHLAAEDIAQIEATGKTGLWADVDQACPTGPRQRAILTWNVKATGTQK